MIKTIALGATALFMLLGVAYGVTGIFADPKPEPDGNSEPVFMRPESQVLGALFAAACAAGAIWSVRRLRRHLRRRSLADASGSAGDSPSSEAELRTAKSGIDRHLQRRGRT